MELSQYPGKAEDSPGHRWAGILGTGVAIVTLTLPIVMIASFTPPDSKDRPAPTTIYRSYQSQNTQPYPME